MISIYKLYYLIQITMINSILKFFGSETPAEKPTPELISVYARRNPTSDILQQKILPYDLKAHSEFEGWKRMKVKTYNRQKLRASIEGSSFVDPEFPHTNASISEQDTEINFEWRRIPDVISFCVYASAETYNNFQRIPLTSKKLKEALLFMYRTHPDRFKKLLAEDCNEDGIYEFRLYQKGIIQNVVVDDYVPVVNGQPLMVGPIGQKQIFPMLLEKAIAKVCGSYDRIPEDVDQLLEIIFCGPLRKTRVDELTNTEQVTKIVGQAMVNNGMAGFISKNQPKIRSFGLSENQLYHIVSQAKVQYKDQPSQILYELTSEKKLASWNGKFSHNDVQWDRVSPAQRSQLFKRLQRNKSFFISGNDIPRLFDSLIVLDGTESCNKQWSELQSQVSYPSFATFQLTAPDTVFIRTTTPDPVRNSLIIAKQESPNDYTYIEGAFHQNKYFVELTAKLQPGTYILCSHHDWIINKTGPYTLFLSSNTQTVAKPSISNSYHNFLEIIFKKISESSRKIEPTPDFITLKKIYTIGMMAKETGFAFIHFNLKGTNQKELFVEVNSKILAHQSWEILQPNAGRNTIHLQQGQNQQLMLILKTHKYVSKQVVIFPSTAFNIKT